MKLHPSLVIGGLFCIQASFIIPYSASAADAKPAVARARHKKLPKAAEADPEVLKWVRATWPSFKAADQASIARVLTAVKRDTASADPAWYDQVFAPFLAKQGAGGARFVLDRARAARSDAQARDAAKQVLADALAQKGDDGQPLLPTPGKKPALPAAPAAPAPKKPSGSGAGADPAPIPAPISDGTFAPPNPGSAVPVPPVEGEKEVEAASDAVKKMAEAVGKSEKYQGMFAARLFWLMWDPHGSISFVADDFRKAELVPWVKYHAVAAVMTIQVLGLPEIPANDAVLGKLHDPAADIDGELLAKLLNALRRWATAPEPGKEQKIPLTSGPGRADLGAAGAGGPGPAGRRSFGLPHRPPDGGRSDQVAVRVPERRVRGGPDAAQRQEARAGGGRHQEEQAGR